jgi:hypothetical protein
VDQPTQNAVRDRGDATLNPTTGCLKNVDRFRWRGRPLRTYETIVSLISNTRTDGGLVVRAQLDRRKYPTGRKVSAEEIRALKIERDAFHGDWNYVIRPRRHAS